MTNRQLRQFTPIGSRLPAAWIALLLAACSASPTPGGSARESNPERIANFIEELDGSDTTRRESAFQALKTSDPAVSVPLLEQSLKTPKSGDGYWRIHKLLAVLTDSPEWDRPTSLFWLARHQSADGRWDADGFHAECGKIIRGTCGGPGSADHDVGVTGLALLAFMGADFVHTSRGEIDGIHFGQIIKKGLMWLIANQTDDGCFVKKRSPGYMYDHAIAALALSEAYCMTASPFLKESAQKGIRYLVTTQNPERGWGKTAADGDNDTSVTGWCVLALRSAEMSGLDVPRSAFMGVQAWLDEATGDDFRVLHGSNDKSQHAGPEGFASHETMTAMGIWSRILIRRDKADPHLKGGVALLSKDLPIWEPAKMDFYYWYYATKALFQYDGPGGPCWSAWRVPMRNTLVANRKGASCDCAWGSWDPVDRWGREGGRVYATAINLLTLQHYYKYGSTFSATKEY